MAVPSEVRAAVAEKIVPLADEYAQQIVDAFPHAESEEMLHQGISGALLSFFADAVVALGNA